MTFIVSPFLCVEKYAYQLMSWVLKTFRQRFVAQCCTNSIFFNQMGSWIKQFDDPTNNSFVKNLLESKRQIHKPKIKKDTIPHNFIIDLCEKYKDCIDLGVIRDLVIIVLCYVVLFFEIQWS